jgi:glycerol kinase
MEADAGMVLEDLRCDGGMAGNELLMQFQADILDRRVLRPAMRETTALGAAYAAGLGCGIFRSTADLVANWAVDKVCEPRMAETQRTHLYQQWKKAVTRTFDWIEQDT